VPELISARVLACIEPMAAESPLTGFRTLLYKEVLRFWKVSFQTVAAPVLNALLFLLIFSPCARPPRHPTARSPTPASWCPAW
jgi:ABC-2 type transport system permease protein